MNFPDGCYFSIIIPCYNVEEYILDCLNSVKSQVYENWECLCVDDGSSDNTGKILDEQCIIDTRIKVFHKQNEGVSSARNVALDNASGKWVVFLDSDDILAPDVLGQLAVIAENDHKNEIISFNSIEFDDGKQPGFSQLEMSLDGLITIDVSKDVPSKYVLSSFWAKIYQRRLIGDSRFAPIPSGEDLLFMLEVTAKAKWFCATNLIGYGYRQRVTSVSHRGSAISVLKSRLYYVQAAFSLFDRYSNKCFDASIRNAYASKITYQFANDLVQLDEISRREVMIEWQSVLRHIACSLPFFRKLQVLTFLFCPTYFLAQLIFCMPQKLLRCGSLSR